MAATATVQPDDEVPDGFCLVSLAPDCARVYLGPFQGHILDMEARGGCSSLELHDEDVLPAVESAVVQGSLGGARQHQVAALQVNSASVVPPRSAPLEGPYPSGSLKDHDEEVGAAGIGKAIEAAPGVPCHHGAAVVQVQRPGGVILRAAPLHGPAPSAGGAELQEEDVGAASAFAAIQLATGLSCHPGVAEAVQAQCHGFLVCRTAPLHRPLPGPRSIELGQEEVLATGIGVPIQGPRSAAGHQDVAFSVHAHRLREVIFLAAPLHHEEPLPARPELGEEDIGAAEMVAGHGGPRVPGHQNIIVVHVQSPGVVPGAGAPLLSPQPATL
mmetsp:Transcript_104444/g.248480  ORF Transcript_104444/g.248480 Transcript_104444/m.248480 type:complete len:329 (+) Transcript_104444:181-1167(+)